MSAPILGFIRVTQNVARFSLFLSFLFLLGCLDLDFPKVTNTDPSSNTYSDTQIEGQAVNSSIDKGIVRAYEVVHSEDNSVISTTPFGLPIRTDKDGFFSFKIPNDIEADTILIKITADDTTTMTCDVIAGCELKGAETKAEFGTTFKLDDSFEMTAFLPTLDHGFTNSVSVNTLTHLASSLAKSKDSGPTIENINTSYRHIESLFGFSARALHLTTPDLTKLNNETELSHAATKVAILSASFLALLNSPDWESISAIILHATDRISLSGTIAAANMGALREVSLDDLFYQAGETTKGLLAQTENLDSQNTLNNIGTEVQASYELTMIAPEILSPPEIQTHPASQEILEGLGVIFSVDALGDDLSYQWRLNYLPIQGANEANFTLNETSLENAGAYDVIVSNVIGSQISLSALLNIIPAEDINSLPPTDAGQPTDTGNEQPTDAEQPTDTSNEQPTDAEQPTDTSNEQPTDAEQPTDIENEQPTDAEQPSDIENEQPTDAEQPSDIENEQPTDSEQPTETDNEQPAPPQNTPPVAQNDTIEVFEDTPTVIPVLVNDSDADSDLLMITNAIIINGPGNVAIQNVLQEGNQTSQNLLFTPEQDSIVPSTISYTISDGHNHNINALVNVNIFPINDTPIATPDIAEVNEDTPVTLDILANDYDADNDLLSISSASSASGSVDINPNNTITFLALSDFTGIAEINYILLDGHGGISSGTATVTVINVNDPPVALDDNAETLEETPVTINALTNDSDIELDQLSITHASSLQGFIDINPDNTLTFTPKANFSGTTTLDYTINDGNEGIASAQVHISVIPVNDSPKAINDSAETNEDTPVIINVLNNDQDADNDTLKVTFAEALTTGGLVSLNRDSTLTFVPTDDFEGEVKLSYNVDDGNGGVASAEVAITVNPINDLPILSNHQATTEQSVAISIDALAGAYDIDSDTLTIISSTANNGQTTVQDTLSIVYLPSPNFSGEDTIHYTVSDGHGGLATATITVQVNAAPKFYSIALNWEHPEERDDGSYLDPSDIKGYTIFYGENASQLDSSLFVTGSASTSYTINNLNPGVHYFAIATVTKDNIQGTLSETITISAGQ